MPRAIVVGNGNVTVALDSELRIRDFMYPLVGLENHAVGHFFRIGVWVDGSFSWVGEGWSISMAYLPETNVSRCLAINPQLGVQLEINDAVYTFRNLFIRKVAVVNLTDTPHEVQVFFSHDFHIYGEDYGDTVIYESSTESIIHYKRERYFLINGVTDRDMGIFQFATGKKESAGKEGTWRDAEDGVLEKNPVAQGFVDSTVSFKLEMAPKAVHYVYYWIACGTSQTEVKELNHVAKSRGVEQLLLETENYWSAWVNKHEINLTVLPKQLITMFKRSLLIMRTHLDNRGAIVASCDSDILQFNNDTYAYMWPRDGAIIALAFDKAGFQEVSRLFFEFCNRVLTDDGYFMHKYWSSGAIGSTWHGMINAEGQAQLPIQLDETALVVYALWKHFQKYRDIEFITQVYPRLVVNTRQFLVKHRNEQTGLPEPTFDMWEERTGVFTSTSCCVASALSSAAKFSKVFFDSKRQEQLEQVASQMKEGIIKHLYDASAGRFVKAKYPNGSRDLTVDGSLAFAFLCETFPADSSQVTATMKAINEHLWVKTQVGGVARYEGDNYHRASADVPGNPWIICTLWLARWQIQTASNMAELKQVLGLFDWVVKHAAPSGILAEQIDPYNARPLSVSPLIWSHAEFVIAICEYVEKYERLIKE